MDSVINTDNPNFNDDFPKSIKSPNSNEDLLKSTPLKKSNKDICDKRKEKEYPAHCIVVPPRPRIRGLRRPVCSTYKMEKKRREKKREELNTENKKCN